MELFRNDSLCMYIHMKSIGMIIYNKFSPNFPNYDHCIIYNVSLSAVLSRMDFHFQLIFDAVHFRNIYT